MSVASRILLVGWDAADWRLIDPLLAQGRLPALAALLKDGLRGNLASIDPLLSPLIWTSIATGKMPHKHGVLGFVEPDDLTTGIRSVGSGTRCCKALWNILSEAGRKPHVVGWFASHPAEDIGGICVSERFALPYSPHPLHWPLNPGSVTPANKAAALAERRVHPRDITAEQLQPFLRHADEIDQSAPEQQERLLALARILAQAGSVQGAATWILENEPWDFLAVYFRAIDDMAHHFMPFRPPLRPDVDAGAARHFGEVMNTALEFHDLMLARLMALAGKDAVVILVSDHGFESGELRPGPVANDKSSMAGWHRPFGVLAMRGPEFLRGERLLGASVLDIAPTILQLAGLPVARDMDGKVLASAWRTPPEIQRMDSWEAADAARPALAPVDPDAERAALAQLAALGYLEAASPESAALAVEAAEEIEFNRITSLLQSNEVSTAVEVAERLTARSPGVRRFRLKLAQARLLAGNREGAEQALRQLESESGPCSASQRMWANLAVFQGEPDAALAHLETAAKLGGRGPAILEQEARILLQQRLWAAAEAKFREVLAIEPDSPHSLTGLAAATARQGRLNDALDIILQSLGLLYLQPAGHLQLGTILLRMGLHQQAINALEAGLLLAPGTVLAHRYLARLYRQKGNLELADAHRANAMRLSGRTFDD